MYNLTAADFGKAAAGSPAGGKKKKTVKTAEVRGINFPASTTYGLSKSKVAPHAALLGATVGAGVGGIKGLFDGGDYDKDTGEKDNRIQAVLKGMAGGAGLGGLAGAALPFVAGSPLYGDTVGKLHKKILMHQIGS